MPFTKAPLLLACLTLALAATIATPAAAQLAPMGAHYGGARRTRAMKAS